MTVAAAPALRPEPRGTKRESKIARRVAAVAGAAGAAVAGNANADGIVYVPTTGVLAAQGIPGFSFTAPTTVTSGTLRPPATEGNTNWDIDGNGQIDFFLENFRDSGQNSAFFVPLAPFAANPNGLLAGATTGSQNLREINSMGNVSPGATAWNNGRQWMTLAGNVYQPRQNAFSNYVVGYFGFRFAFNNNPNDYYYGWGSLTIDYAAEGQGFKINEAFYQSTPNTAINVGAVPVPEPSSMALLAAGAAGVTAWRARKKKQPAAE